MLGRASYLLDHKEICVTEDGEYVLICSPYGGMVTAELQEHCEMYGYVVESSGFRPYMGVIAREK